MELADKSMELAACADDFSNRSKELAHFIDVFGLCSDVFARYSEVFWRYSEVFDRSPIVKTHRMAARARSTME
jgi:hypothetical protein